MTNDFRCFRASARRGWPKHRFISLCVYVRTKHTYIHMSICILCGKAGCLWATRGRVLILSELSKNPIWDQETRAHFSHFSVNPSHCIFLCHELIVFIDIPHLLPLSVSICFLVVCVHFFPLLIVITAPPQQSVIPGAPAMPVTAESQFKQLQSLVKLTAINKKLYGTRLKNTTLSCQRHAPYT